MNPGSRPRLPRLCLAFEASGPGVCSLLFCDVQDPGSCGAGQRCVTVDAQGTTACFDLCTAAAGGCESGLTCQPVLGIASACLAPECTSTADCAAAPGTSRLAGPIRTKVPSSASEMGAAMPTRLKEQSTSRTMGSALTLAAARCPVS
jgi:hypothetical protein